MWTLLLLLYIYGFCDVECIPCLESGRKYFIPHVKNFIIASCSNLDYGFKSPIHLYKGETLNFKACVLKNNDSIQEANAGHSMTGRIYNVETPTCQPYMMSTNVSYSADLVLKNHVCYAGENTFSDAGVYNISMILNYVEQDQWMAMSKEAYMAPLFEELVNLIGIVTVTDPLQSSAAAPIRFDVNKRELEWYQENRCVPDADNDNYIYRSLQMSSSLPLCKDGDSGGRWIYYADTMNSLESVRQWHPYSCVYRPFLESMRLLSAIKHAENRKPSTTTSSLLPWNKMDHLVYLWGDSNSRRVMKYVHSYGRWCYRNDQAPHCRCEDNGPRNHYEYRYIYVHVYYYIAKFNFVHHCLPVVFVRFTSLNTCSEMISRNLTTGQYLNTSTIDPTNRTIGTFIFFTFTGGVKDASLEYRVQTSLSKHMPPPEVLILSLGNWDAAYLSMDLFVERVEASFASIKKCYGANVPIIWRSVNYMCCGLAGTRLLTEKKNRRYNDVVMALLKYGLETFCFILVM